MMYYVALELRFCSGFYIRHWQLLLVFRYIYPLGFTGCVLWVCGVTIAGPFSNYWLLFSDRLQVLVLLMW